MVFQGTSKFVIDCVILILGKVRIEGFTGQRLEIDVIVHLKDLTVQIDIIAKIFE